MRSLARAFLFVGGVIAAIVVAPQAEALGGGAIGSGGSAGGVSASAPVFTGAATIADGTACTAPSVHGSDADTGVNTATTTATVCANGTAAVVAATGGAVSMPGNVSQGDAATDTQTVTGITTHTWAPAADSGATDFGHKIVGTIPADTAGTNTHHILKLSPTIGNATGGTNVVDVISIDAVTGDAQVTLRGINIGALTGTGATEYGINVGAGWDMGLSLSSPLQVLVSGNNIGSSSANVITSNVSAGGGADTFWRLDSTGEGAGDGLLSLDGKIIFKADGAVAITGTVPTAGGTCTTPAILASSNPSHGMVSAASCTAGQTMTASWASTRAAAPDCVCTPANAAAGAATALVFCDASTTILTVTAVGGVTAPEVNYVCFE